MHMFREFDIDKQCYDFKNPNDYAQYQIHCKVYSDITALVGRSTPLEFFQSSVPLKDVVAINCAVEHARAAKKQHTIKIKKLQEDLDRFKETGKIEMIKDKKGGTRRLIYGK